MTWIAPVAIAGGALAAGPIIIHLLFRLRHRVIYFAAMRFLLDSLRRSRQRLQLEELLLIALRVLACLLLGFGLANIRAESRGTAGPAAHVFVLDDSLSTGQQVADATVLSKAAAGIAEVLASARGDDRVAILSGSRPGGGDVRGTLKPVSEVRGEELTARLKALRPTDLPARLPEALELARRLLPPRTEMDSRVYLVSDFRKADFAAPGRPEQLRKAFAALADQGAEIVLLDYGLPCSNNLTVEKLETDRKLLAAGVASRFGVLVRNNGTSAVNDARLSVRAGKVKLPVVALPAVAPGETTTGSFEYAFPRAGAAAVTVALPADGLAGDNELSLAANVREAMRILIVDGSANIAAPDSASFCLAAALDPSGSTAFAQQVEVIGPGALPRTGLDRYDVIFLTDVREFPSARDANGAAVWPHVRALEQFVGAAGGLGVFLGPSINLDFYNGPMYRRGAGLMPLRLAGPVPDRIDPNQFRRLRPDSIAPGTMLRIFTGRGERFAGLVRFYAHVPVEQAPATAPAAPPAALPEILARFDDAKGSPAAARRALGRGQVIAFFTSADTKWTNWPKGMSFLPVVNDMAWQLARADRQLYHDLAGRRIAYAVPAGPVELTGVTLKTPAWPEEDLQSLRPQIVGGRRTLTYAAAVHAGAYEMELSFADRSRRTVLFSRQVDPAEGDLARATDKDIAAAVNTPHTWRPNLALGGPVLERQTVRRPYWAVFLAAMLLVLTAENFLARRFGHQATHGLGARRPRP